MENNNRYQSGKIYTIKSYKTDFYYIGSTCIDLSKRLKQHQCNYKRYINGKSNYVTSFDILVYDDHYIELLENFKCESRKELIQREGELIKLHKNNLVNKNVAGRNHKDSVKEYGQTNQEKLRIKRIAYYQTNQEKIKTKVKEYQQIKFICCCGSEISRYKKARHETTTKHIKFINL